MTTKKFLLACTIIVAANLHAQVNVFALLNDTSSNFKDAHTIKQYERNEFIVTDIDKAVLKTRTIITVLDKQGENDLSFVEYTSSFNKLEDAQITIYNQLGLPQKTYTKKDLRHQASGEGLIDDGIYYFLHLGTDQYPITVEFQKTMRLKGIVRYPSFDIQQPGQAVRHAEHIVTVPKDFDLRYKNQETTIVPETKTTDASITYAWQVNNLAAIQNEEGSVSWESRFPAVLIAPNKFKLDNYAGDLNSWQAFGKWYGDLGLPALNLTEFQKAAIRSMTEKVSNPKEKIKIVYEYLQENFRYVSIQLGIGGFRSFPASFTHENRFGDCKALSTYMQACLQAINIKSYQALINAGNYKAPVNADFPIDLFNHVIVCVPMDKDSIWLECTSKHNDFGVLGNFTENRNALLITENGGVLVPTPVSTAKENRYDIKAIIKLLEDGSGQVRTTITASGEYKQRTIYQLFNERADDQKAALISQLDMPMPERFEVHLPASKKAIALTTQLDATFEKIPAFSAGNKMFLHAQWHKLITQYLPKKDTRTLDYYFPHPFEKHDTTIYEIPAGFVIENIPAPFDLVYKYGEYHSRIDHDKTTNKITSISSLVLLQQKIPASDFMATKRFFGQVVNDEIQKIVIKKE